MDIKDYKVIWNIKVIRNIRDVRLFGRVFRDIEVIWNITDNRDIGGLWYIRVIRVIRAIIHASQIRFKSPF
jgi:hypothetical protein